MYLTRYGLRELTILRKCTKLSDLSHRAICNAIICGCSCLPSPFTPTKRLGGVDFVEVRVAGGWASYKSHERGKWPILISRG